MNLEDTRQAYGRRAAEYAARLGEVELLAPADRRTIETWADGVTGPILDLGCGPGQWAAHLAGRGHAVTGWDPVPAFVEATRARGVPARTGQVADLAGTPGAWGGILAWYSLIHLEPAAMPAALTGLHGALRPGGRLLLGFFDTTSSAEPFDHAVARAYAWPCDVLAGMAAEVGFRLDQVERRTDPGARPHAAIHARRP